MKNCIKISLVIIGALIGAGFASGQEIYLFFFSYGEKGILGIIASSILLGIIIYKTIIIINRFQNLHIHFLVLSGRRNRLFEVVICLLIISLAYVKHSPVIENLNVQLGRRILLTAFFRLHHWLTRPDYVTCRHLLKTVEKVKQRTVRDPQLWKISFRFFQISQK